VGAAELYRELRRTSFIDSMGAGELAELHSPEELERRRSELESLLRRVEEADISPYDKRLLIDICRRRLNKLREALELARAPPSLELEADLVRGEVLEGDIVEVRYAVRNPSGRRATVRLECPAGDGLEPLSSAREVELGAGERYEGFFEFRAAREGRLKLGPLRAVARFEGDGEVSREVGPLSVSVKPLRVGLEVSVSGPASVREGEPVGIRVRLANSGSAPLDVSVGGLEGWEGWRGRLAPGEVREFEIRLSLPPGVHVVKPSVRYRDPSGRELEAQVEGVRVEVVRPAEEKVEERLEEGPRPAAEEVRLDVEGLVSSAAAHALAALGGYLLGRKLGEVRRYSKPVLVQGDLLWSKITTPEGEEATVILEHPAAVVVEDRGEYVQVRRAEVRELLASTDRRLARRLQAEFVDRAEAVLRDWSPPTLAERAQVSVKRLNLSERELEELREELKRAGLKLDEDAARELPDNVLLEVAYRTGRALKRTEYRVYVLAYSRLRQLYFSGVDHRPMSLAEALEVVRGRVEGSGRGVLVLASPTGWDPQSVEEVRSRPPSGLSLVLVDLKTGEVYRGPADPAVDELVNLLARGRLALPPPREREEEVERLVELLLSGRLSEEAFWEYVGRAALKREEAASSRAALSGPEAS